MKSPYTVYFTDRIAFAIALLNPRIPLRFIRATCLQIFTLAKAPSPQRENHMSILFHATKNTFHLCVLCAFARKNTTNHQIPGLFSQARGRAYLLYWLWELARQSLQPGIRTWSGRKVRAPQDRMPGNAWGVRAYGKCHRKYTAPLSRGKGEMVR
jgi:hypothetical protein